VGTRDPFRRKRRWQSGSRAEPNRDQKEARKIRAGNGATDLVKVAEKCKSQVVSMTKADLITIIADKLRFPWARAEMLVDVVFDSLEQSMSRGEKIEVCATCPNYPYTRADTASVNVRL